MIGFPEDPQKLALLAMGLGLLGGAPRSNKNFGADLAHGGLLGLQAYGGAKQAEQRAAEEAQQREMRAMQMAQLKAAQEAAQQRQSAIGSLAQQRPELAPLFQLAPDKAIDRAFPTPKMQFAPNGQAVDMNALKPGQNFAKPDLPAGMQMGPNGPEPIPAYVQMQERIRAAGRPQVTTNVMPPREVFKDSMALKKDFDAQPEVKGFKEVQSAWDQISTALSDPSAANDLAAATKFMKLLDPGSVVRESELAMAMQASGALDRFMNYGNRIMKGHKLTPTQRDEFRSAGEALYNASKGRFGETVNQYQGIANQYGLDAQFIPKEVPKGVKLQRNMTATFKAREAIKKGADREAVRQRLIEQGYDPSGL